MRSIWMAVPLVALTLGPCIANAELSPAQQKEAAARMQLAGAIASKYEAEATTNKYSADWKIAMMNTLLALPSSSLQTLAADRSVATHRGMMQKAATAKSRTAKKALNDFGEDLVFIPISPCRLVDTRNTGAGPILGGTARGFAEESGATQGGTGACSTALSNAYPLGDAGAYAVNLTLVNMSTNGFATVRPVGSSNVTSLVNFTGPGQQVNNFAIVQNLNNSGNEFEVYVSATVDVIIDVFGVFGRPEATALDCYVDDATTQVVANGATWNFNSGACATGYSYTGGGSYAFDENAYVHSAPGSSLPNTFCYGRNVSGASTTVRCAAVCCRIPGR